MLLYVREGRTPQPRVPPVLHASREEQIFCFIPDGSDQFLLIKRVLSAAAMHVSGLAVVVLACLVPAMSSAQHADPPASTRNSAIHLQPLVPTADGNSTPRRGRQHSVSRKSGALLAVTVAAFTALFLMLKCFQVIHSRPESTAGGAKRSLAVGGAGEEPCDAGTPSAPDVLSALTVSEAEAESLTSQQKSLLNKAKEEASKGFNKHRHLSKQELDLRAASATATHQHAVLKQTEPESAQTYVAKQHADSARLKHLQCNQQLQSLTLTISSWVFGPEMHPRALTLMSRCHTAGRHISATAAAAIVLAEKVTRSGPPQVTVVPAAYFQAAKHMVTSRASQVSAAAAALTAAAASTPPGPGLDEEVTKAVRTHQDMVFLCAMLSSTSLRNLEKTLREANAALHDTVLSVAGQTPEQLAQQLQHLAVEDVQHPGGAGEGTEGQESGPEDTINAGAGITLTAKMQDWSAKAKDLLSTFEAEVLEDLDEIETVVHAGGELLSALSAAAAPPPATPEEAEALQVLVKECRSLLEGLVEQAEPLWSEVIDMHKAAAEAALQQLEALAQGLPPDGTVEAGSPFMAHLQHCSSTLHRARAASANMSLFTAVHMPPTHLPGSITLLESTIAALEAALEKAAKTATAAWKNHMLKLRDAVKAGTATKEQLIQAGQKAAAFTGVVKTLLGSSQGSSSGAGATGFSPPSGP